MIETRALEKTFFVNHKAPGLRASLRSLIVRQKIPKYAVRGVDLKVESGEIVGLLGANGAGKTTLIKMLAGIIHPTAGEARVLGHEPWKRDNEFRRQIALVMGQKAQLWWDLPAADGFLLLKEIYRVPDAAYRERVEHLSDLLDVADLLTTQIRRLSLGERMKMELIAALLHAPKVIFLDEPTIGLDLTAQRAIRDFILGYRAKHQPAMILTSHYLEDIQRLCKRIVILRDGELVYDGSLARVVEQYATHKVVTVHLRRDGQPCPTAQTVGDLGEVIQVDADTLKVRVPRGSVADAAAELLNRCSVADLLIEEPDVGEIIERILTARGEAVS